LLLQLPCQATWRTGNISRGARNSLKENEVYDAGLEMSQYSSALRGRHSDSSSGRFRQSAIDFSTQRDANVIFLTNDGTAPRGFYNRLRIPK
jgi:hypothetical protein